MPANINTDIQEGITITTRCMVIRELQLEVFPPQDTSRREMMGCRTVEIIETLLLLLVLRLLLLRRQQLITFLSTRTF